MASLKRAPRLRSRPPSVATVAAPAWRRRTVMILVLLSGTLLLAYSPALRARFVNWDDDKMVFQNPLLNPPSMSGLERFWRAPYWGLYVPLTYTTYSGLAALSYAMAGALAPGLFHAFSLLVHIWATAMVFLILRRLLNDDWPAAAGAALFGLHPIQVESVAWVASLNTLLSAALGMTAVYLYIRHAEASQHDKPCLGWYLAATGVALLAMLAKPTALVLPLIVSAIDLLLLRRPARRIAIAVGLWCLIALPVALVGRTAQPTPDAVTVPIWARPLVAADTSAFYLYKVLVPATFWIDYGRSPAWLLRSHAIYWTWILPVAAFVLVWVLARRRRWPVGLTGFALIVAGIAPVLGLIRFDYQAYSTAADRYFYWSMLGVALIAAGVLHLWRGPVARTLAIVLLAALALRSYAQAQNWHDTDTLTQHGRDVDPDSRAALKLFAAQLSRIAATESDPSLRQAAFQQAVDVQTRALSIKPDDTEALFNRANALANLGRLDDAIRDYAAAARLDAQRARQTGTSEDPDYHTNYAMALMRANRPADAGEQFADALKLAPGRADVRANWGSWLRLRGRLAEAEAAYHAALQIDPNNRVARDGLTILHDQAAPQSLRP